MYKVGLPIFKILTLPFANIYDVAQQVGFDACSVTSVHRLDTDALWMDQWIEAGHHGEMTYLERNRELRYDPSVLVSGARTMVVVLLSYAHSGHDYHRAVKSRLYQMEGILVQQYGMEIVSPTQQHIFCDSAPVLERRWAVEAGLGWIGRNHQFIHPVLGSMVHLGEWLLQVPVSGAPMPSPMPSCGDCHLCQESCPTGVLRNAVWHAPDCIAYTTHNCLVCQQNCPYNETII